MTTDGPMHQEAPYPAALARLVGQLRYRDNWRFELRDIDRGQGSRGLTLIITARVPNSYEPYDDITVAHYMPVPPAAYDERSWQRWLFDQCQLVDRHEAMELFRLVRMPSYVGQDGEQHELIERPYAPSHGPGNDPYLIREIGTRLDQRTAFTGEVNPE
jgi:hypothetical protein